MGDSRGKKSSGINEPIFHTLLKSIKRLSVQPDFILFLGDMVSGGSRLSKQLESWKGIISDYYSINLVVPSIGNHEGNETIFSDAFNYLPNEQLSGYQRTVYYFDYLNTRVIVLNSVRTFKDNYIINYEELIWLENLLKTNKKTHCFVAFHVPPYPTGHHYGKALDSIPEMRNALWSIIDKYNVTAVIAAHEHNYSHRIIDSSFSIRGYYLYNQIHQIITGGAGAPLNSKFKDSKGVIAGPIGVNHFVVADITNNSVIFNAYDIKDNLLDSFRIHK